MSLIKGNCPNCGGTLDINKNADAAICNFCNTPFIVEKAVQLYQTQNTYNTVNNITDSVVHIAVEKSAEEQYAKITALLNIKEKKFAQEQLEILIKTHPESPLLEEAKFQFWLFDRSITPYGKNNLSDLAFKDLLSSELPPKIFKDYYPQKIAQLNDNLNILTGFDFKGDMPLLKTALGEIEEKLPKGLQELCQHENRKREYKKNEELNEVEFENYISEAKAGRTYSPQFKNNIAPLLTDLSLYAKSVRDNIDTYLNQDYGIDGSYLAYVYAALTKDDTTKDRMQQSIDFLDGRYKDIIKENWQKTLEILVPQREKKRRADYALLVKEEYEKLCRLYDASDFKSLNEQLEMYARVRGIKFLEDYRKENIKGGVFGYKCKSPLPSWETVKANSKYKDY